MPFFNLKTALPALLPQAIQWAEGTAAASAMAGRVLNEAEQEIARRVGVAHPDKIRLAFVDEMPYPEHRMLQAAAMATDFLGPQTQGLTLGYTVLVRRGRGSDRLLSHEFRHVHQYEEAGSIAGFLSVYLGQMVDFGYEDAPLEIDARAHEIGA